MEPETQPARGWRPAHPPPRPLPREHGTAPHRFTGDPIVVWCVGFVCGIGWMIAAGAVIDRVLS